MTIGQAPRPSYDRATPVLIVDDEYMMVEVITAMLNKLGLRDVDFACDGLSALAQLRERAYGLVISDLKMAGIDGLEFVRRMRTDAALRHTPFIMTTASRDLGVARQAKAAGVDHYLLKPFRSDALHAKLEAVIGEHALMLSRMRQIEAPSTAHKQDGRAVTSSFRRED